MANWYTGLNIDAASIAENIATDAEKSTRAQIVQLVQQLVNPTSEVITASEGAVPDGAKWKLISYYDPTAVLTETSDASKEFKTDIANLTYSSMQRGSFFESEIRYYTNSSYTEETNESNIISSTKYTVETVVKGIKTPQDPSFILLRCPDNMIPDLNDPTTTAHPNVLYILISFEYKATMSLATKLTDKKASKTVPYATKAHITTVDVTPNDNIINVYFILGKDGLTADSLGLTREGFNKKKVTLNGFYSWVPTIGNPSDNTTSYQTRKSADLSQDLLYWTYSLPMNYTINSKIKEGSPKIHLAMNDKGYFWAATTGLGGDSFDFFMGVFSQDNKDYGLNNSSFLDTASNQKTNITGILTYAGNAANLLDINGAGGDGTCSSDRKNPYIEEWLAASTFPVTTDKGLTSADRLGSNFISLQRGNGQYYYWVPVTPLQFGSIYSNKSGHGLKSFPEDLPIDVVAAKGATTASNTTQGLTPERSYNTFPVYMYDWSDSVFDKTDDTNTYIRTSLGVTGQLDDVLWGTSRIQQGTINTDAEDLGVGGILIGCFWFPVNTYSYKINF